MLQAYQLKDKFSEKALITAWERMMGRTISSRTVKLFITEKTLFVELDSAPLKHELNSSKDKIFEILEKEFGSGVVKEIVFL